MHRILIFKKQSVRVGSNLYVDWRKPTSSVVKFSDQEIALSYPEHVPNYNYGPIISSFVHTLYVHLYQDVNFSTVFNFIIWDVFIVKITLRVWFCPINVVNQSITITLHVLALLNIAYNILTTTYIVSC